MAAANTGTPTPPVGKLIHCPVCGKAMTIPAGYENTPGKCTACGATVNDGAESLVDMLDPPLVSSRRAAPAQRGEVGAREPYGRPWFKAALWGLVGGGGGAAVAMAGMTAHKGTTGDFSLTALLSGAGYGLTIGFVLAFGWALNRYGTPRVWTSALVGGGTAAVLGTGSYLVEWAAVAPPDFGVIETAIMYLMGGGVAGIILWYCSTWWDEHS